MARPYSHAVTAASGGHRDLDERIERARRGDPDAFVELVTERERSMVRTAMAILGDAADANDALQDALTSIWLNLPSLRDADRFGVWADRILVNSCRLTLRRRARGRVRQISLEAVDPLRLVGADAPDESVADGMAIGRAFDHLSVDERAILTFHYLDDRPLAEIAAILGIPVGTVKSRLHTARRALERALLEERR
jgi:RNA polymerase sigma-70 factor, ECF subfamily